MVVALSVVPSQTMSFSVKSLKARHEVLSERLALHSLPDTSCLKTQHFRTRKILTGEGVPPFGFIKMGDQAWEDEMEFLELSCVPSVMRMKVKEKAGVLNFS